MIPQQLKTENPPPSNLLLLYLGDDASDCQVLVPSCLD